MAAGAAAEAAWAALELAQVEAALAIERGADDQEHDEEDAFDGLES
jgi:hypothetical protein